MSKTTSEINVVTGGSTAPIQVTRSLPLSIIPVYTGAGTATIKVSNDGINFANMTLVDTTVYDFSEPVIVTSFLWDYILFEVQSGGTGVVKFVMEQR